jgi:alpha-galactosidase
MELIAATLGYNGKICDLPLYKHAFFDELYVEFRRERVSANTERTSLTLHPKQGIVVDRIQFDYRLDLDLQNDRLMLNGYQSWTESREYAPMEVLAPLHSLAKRFLEPYGDYAFVKYSNQAGQLHSWTYTYIRQAASGQLLFLGSLAEATGFTRFEYHSAQKKLTVIKDCSGLHLEHSYPALDLLQVQGTDNEVFDAYFAALGIAPPKVPPISGWTSWYNYYTKINEHIILENAQAIASHQLPAQVIQIDDGYQQYVGDWMDIKTSAFPNGMDAVARQLHHMNFKAGIWLAPFVCEQQSNLYKTKPHWILKDDKGKPVKAGYNPLWTGWFYALDFYNKEVQDYISHVIIKMVNVWGFDLLKLDFLYAVALHPPKNKTRGQVMHEALAFIRNLTSDKWLLACGVPLAAAFGQVDYCRIGADVHLRWEHFWLRKLHNRERVSTLLALRNTLGRRQLNGRAFWNDPDVFILRKNNHHLNQAEQSTLLLVNTLLGGLLFTSDNTAKYNKDQLFEYQNSFYWQNAHIHSVSTPQPDFYVINFEAPNHRTPPCVAYCNLSEATVQYTHQRTTQSLAPHDSIILPR